MTQEEKAKAYDEVLERAQKATRAGSDVAMDIIQYIFPNINDSEDERIRKALIWHLKAGEDFVSNGVTKEQTIAWLEKQKPSFKQISDSVIWDSGLRTGIELGKQKEQDKCPEYCVRSHCIGCSIYEKQKEQKPNFHTRWENGSMVCEMKHYWKPTETDVALFNKAVTTNKALTPAERAQLDIIRSKFGCCRATNCSGIVQEENPEEPKIAFGDWGDKEKQEAIFTCLKYMRFIKKITNQEYNDLTEWLNDNLVSNVLEKDGWTIANEQTDTIKEDYYGAFLRGEMRGYLRGTRQKEQKDFNKLYEDIAKSEWFQKSYNGKSLGCDDAQKPVTEVFGFKVGDAVRLKDGDGRKHIIKAFEKIEGIHGPDFYHVVFEDDSASDHIIPGKEYPKGYYTQMEKFEEEPGKDKDFSDCLTELACELYECHDESDTPEDTSIKEYHVLEKWEPILLKKAQQQEWSEEDSDNLERVDDYLWMLDDYVGDDCAMPQGKTDKIRGNIQGILSPWLKSLPERFNLQPKEEWSEEDEKILQSIIKDFRAGKVSTIGQEQWLKSLSERFVLQPKPERSR